MSPAWPPARAVGHTGVPLRPNGEPVDFGDAANDLRDGSLGLSDARALGVFDQRISDEGIPTIVSMVNALDGYEENGVVLETTEESVTDDGTARATRRRSSASPSSASSTSSSTPWPARR